MIHRTLMWVWVRLKAGDTSHLPIAQQIQHMRTVRYGFVGFGIALAVLSWLYYPIHQYSWNGPFDFEWLAWVAFTVGPVGLCVFYVIRLSVLIRKARASQVSPD